MNRATREALAYVMDEMTARLEKRRSERDQLAAQLAEINAEIGVLETRMRAVQEDLNQ